MRVCQFRHGGVYFAPNDSLIHARLSRVGDSIKLDDVIANKFEPPRTKRSPMETEVVIVSDTWVHRFRADVICL